MKSQRIEPLERELAALREEVRALRERVGELGRRLDRLEVREKILESPAAAGDASEGYP